MVTATIASITKITTVAVVPGRVLVEAMTAVAILVVYSPAFTAKETVVLKAIASVSASVDQLQGLCQVHDCLVVQVCVCHNYL
jgi:hypothetical protein